MYELKLKNVHLNYVVDFLRGPLHNSDTRCRNRFLKQLNPAFIAFDAERVDIYEKHADRDEAGEIVYENVDKMKQVPGGRMEVTKMLEIKLSPAGEKAAIEEYNELKEAWVTFSITDNEFVFAHNFLLDSKRQYDADEGMFYDEIMEQFESANHKEI